MDSFRKSGKVSLGGKIEISTFITEASWKFVQKYKYKLGLPFPLSLFLSL